MIGGVRNETRQGVVHCMSFKRKSTAQAIFIDDVSYGIETQIYSSSLGPIIITKYSLKRVVVILFLEFNVWSE